MIEFHNFAKYVNNLSRAIREATSMRPDSFYYCDSHC